MEQSFRNIGLIGRVGNDRVLESVKTLKAFLLERNLTVVLEQEVAEAQEEEYSYMARVRSEFNNSRIEA